MVLGMIPDAPLDKVTSAGNAAGTGARIALCSVAARTYGHPRCTDGARPSGGGGL